MSDLDLIIDLHVRQDRQGPGSDEETRRAIELARLARDARLEVADIGCGAGASSLVLAGALEAQVTAVDAAEAFVDRVRERAAAHGLADRVGAMVGRMESLPFEDESFDVLWSEGAIYNMGFAEGLRAWRRFLRPGGVVAVSELTWTSDRRPADLESYWKSEYPGIGTAAENLERLEGAGYRPLAMFFIPEGCWVDCYFEPLRSGFPAFLARHGRSDAAGRLVAEQEAEISMYRERGEWYGYAFSIGRKLER